MTMLDLEQSNRIADQVEKFSQKCRQEMALKKKIEKDRELKKKNHEDKKDEQKK